MRWGTSAVYMETFDPALAIDLIERHRVTSAGGPPAILQSMFAAPNFAPREAAHRAHVRLRRGRRVAGADARAAGEVRLLRLPLLRHDRVPDVHLRAARRSRGQAARHGRPAGAGRDRAPGRRAGTAGAGRRRGRDRGLRPAAVRRLSRSGAQRRVHRRRLLPHRRPRHRRRRGLHPHHRPAQGHHHPQGREPLGQGHRGRPRRAPAASPTSR